MQGIQYTAYTLRHKRNGPDILSGLSQPLLSWRLLALDVGNVRIGLALSDALGIVVSPYQVIARRPEATALAQIVTIARAEEAVGIVVGLPLSLNGDFSQQTQSVQAFTDLLRAATPLPIIPWDERYTTVEAERILREMGVRRDKWKQQIDAVAATVILQDYLDANRPATLITPEVDWDDDDISE